jgi:hypothetical protein
MQPIKVKPKKIIIIKKELHLKKTEKKETFRVNIKS